MVQGMPHINVAIQIDAKHLLFIRLVMLKADLVLFYYNDHNNLIGIIPIHVDGFLQSGTDDFEESLFQNFEIRL